ncbi:hypothetical protein QUF58_10645 [Anaerolineales bacterium HSG24]|nr:hypothetical protein [Anaerolineales bacterium HSG24]
MTTLTLDFSIEIYQILQQEANRLGKTPQAMVMDWVVRQLPDQSPLNSREQVRQCLKKAGLLTKLGSDLREIAESTSVTREEARSILDQVQVSTLSEIVLEQRGQKGPKGDSIQNRQSKI